MTSKSADNKNANWQNILLIILSFSQIITSMLFIYLTTIKIKLLHDRNINKYINIISYKLYKLIYILMIVKWIQNVYVIILYFLAIKTDCNM